MSYSDILRGFHDLMILKVLSDHDSYCYEVSSTIFEWTVQRYRLKETTLYSSFSRLEKNGYITSYEGQKTHGRMRIYYSITPQGRVYFEESVQSYQRITIMMDEFLEEPHEH